MPRVWARNEELPESIPYGACGVDELCEPAPRGGRLREGREGGQHRADTGLGLGSGLGLGIGLEEVFVLGIGLGLGLG